VVTVDRVSVAGPILGKSEHLVFYCITVSKKKLRYAFQAAKEVHVCHTGPYRPTSSIGRKRHKISHAVVRSVFAQKTTNTKRRRDASRTVDRSAWSARLYGCKQNKQLLLLHCSREQWRHIRYIRELVRFADPSQRPFILIYTHAIAHAAPLYPPIKYGSTKYQTEVDKKRRRNTLWTALRRSLVIGGLVYRVGRKLPTLLHIFAKYWTIFAFLRATACNASRVLAIVEASVRRSVRLLLQYCVNTTHSRITKSSPWIATETLVLGFVKLFSEIRMSLPRSRALNERGYKKWPFLSQ